MAVWSARPPPRVKNGRRVSKKRRASRYVTRPRGAFGTLRSTRFAPLRNVYRRIPPSLNPFPKSRIVRHKYCDTVTLPAGAGAGLVSNYVFRANSLFDPDFTGIGHQPLYRDDMAAKYTYYIVLDSYITVLFDQAASVQSHYGIVLDDDSGGVGNNPTTAWEQYGGSGPLIPSQRYKPLRLKASYNAAREFKTTVRGLMADDTQRIDAGSNPATKQVRYFTIWKGPADPVVTNAAEKITVKIVYVAMWLDPGDATQS